MHIVHQQKNDGYLTVKVSGEMDSSRCAKVQPTIETIIQNGAQATVELDMSRVTFLDSSGVGLIVFMFKRLKATGGDLKLHSVNGQPRELIELLRIDKAMDVSWTHKETHRLAS
ncbi:STAS domain-containing protein [Alteromonas sediminis]|nr:STAS domain-containing protein [Alteromonas sediminis]